MVNAVAETLDKKRTFEKPTFRWNGMKANGMHKRNPQLKKEQIIQIKVKNSHLLTPTMLMMQYT